MPLRHLATLLALTVIQSSFLCPPLVAAIHDFTGRCENCHLSDPQGEGTKYYRFDLDEACRECHQVSDINSHPSQVSPSMEVPQGFWLDGGGRISCATCHSPHPEQAEAGPLLLRGDKQGLDFCRNCHEKLISAAGRHLGTFLAHTRSYTSPVSSVEGPDPLSKGCISCHDGSGGAPHAGFCLHLEEQGCGGHIIGQSYDRLAGSNREIRGRAALDPAISLYEGKIGCLSCHSIYADRPGMLVMDNSGSALCLACHIK